MQYSDEDKEIIRELFKNAFGWGYDELYVNDMIIPSGEEQGLSIKELLSENCYLPNQDTRAINLYAERHNMSEADLNSRIASEPVAPETPSAPTQPQSIAGSYSDAEKQFVVDFLDGKCNEDYVRNTLIPAAEAQGLPISALLIQEFGTDTEAYNNAITAYAAKNPGTSPETLNAMFNAQPTANSISDINDEPEPSETEILNEEPPTNELPFTFTGFVVPEESFVDKDATDKFSKFDTDELKELNGKLYNILDDIEILYDEKAAPYKFDLLFDELNDETKNKLKDISEEFSDSVMFKTKINKVLKYLSDCLSDIYGKIEKSIKTAEGTDRVPSPGGGSGGSSGFINIPGDGGGSNSKPPEKPTESIIGVVGSLTFTAIAPLYETLGATSTIQSNLTGKYDVVGIYLYDNKYFYKIYDQDLKKYYYAEINNTTAFTTNYSQVLKMNEEAMLMTSTKIGDDVLTKYSNPDAVYFVKGTLEDNGIKFALINDSSDGKDYYVPLSSSVELVNLEDFVKNLSANLKVNTEEKIETVG